MLIFLGPALGSMRGYGGRGVRGVSKICGIIGLSIIIPNI